jgi:hypothetical protein
MLTIGKIITKTLILSIFFIGFSWLGAARVSALSPPLDPGCYDLVAGSYETTDCRTEGQARAIVPPLNRCYLIVASNGVQGSLVNSEIECGNARIYNDGDREAAAEREVLILEICGERSNYPDGLESEYDDCVAQLNGYNTLDQYRVAQACGDRADYGAGFEQEYDECVRNYRVENPATGTATDTAPNLGSTGASAADRPIDAPLDISLNDTELEGEYYCGKKSPNEGWVRISFDVGCLGVNYEGPTFNPILDMFLALLRFISAGVGLVVIASIIYAGIQYSASKGNPQQSEAAIKRVANSVIALLLYVFAFALLNFLVPGGLFLS